MITPWTIYWLTRLDTFHEVASVGSFFSWIAMVLVFLWWALECDFEKEDFPKLGFKILSAVFLIFSLILLFVPTTKQMAAILVIPAVANSQTAKELGDATVTLAKQWLEELRQKEKEAQ